ncbi:MAG TPA: hypothetical protein VGN60_01320 [Devosia sp.]|nr:hypothetical protein [Devosia sp.]
MKKSKSEVDGFSHAAKIGFAAVAAAAAAAAAGMAVMVKGSIDNADAMRKSAQAAGVTTEALSRLRYAADLSGVSAGTLDTAMGRLSRTMNDMANGTSNAATKAMDALGLAAVDSEGKLRSSTDVLGDIAERFAGMEDGAQKTATAIEIFGRSGAQLIPLLNAGRGGLAAMTAEADRLGITLTDSTAKSAEQFNDNLTRLSSAAMGFSNQVMAAVLPALVRATDAMVWLSQNSEVLVGGLIEVARYAGVVGAALATYFGPSILAGVGSIAVAIGTTMVGAVKALTLAMMANPIGLLVAAIAGAVAAAFLFRDQIKQAIGVDVVGVFKSVANTMIGLFKGAYDAVIVAWGMLPAAFSDIFTRAMNGAIDIVQNGINGIVGALRNIPGLGDMEGADLSGFKGEETGAANALPGAINQAMVDAQKDYIGEWSEAVTTAWGTASQAVTGFNDQIAVANDNIPALSETADTTDAAMEKIAGGARNAKSAVEDLGDAVAKNAERMSKAMSETANRISSTLDSVTQAMGQSGDEQFGIIKAISIASALIKGWEAVTSSYAAGAALGGPPLGMLYAGLAAAQTAAQIASMQSVTSRSGGTPRASSAASVPNAPQRQQTEKSPDRLDITLHGLDRSAMYSGENVEAFLRAIEARAADGRILNIKVA